MTSFVTPPWAWPRNVTSILLQGPTKEPLTIAQGKLRAGLDWPDGDPRDELMEDFIAAARAQVEHDTGLALLTQTREITFTATPWLGPSMVPLPPQTQPTQSIMQFEPTTAVVVPIERRRRPYQPGVLQQVAYPLTGGTWEVVAGWPDAATLREEAPALYNAVGLLTAHFATAGRDLAASDEFTPLPMGYEALITPHRLIWVT